MLQVPSMSSSSSSFFCYNRECADQFNPDLRYRHGWRLRAGDLAVLCDRCAYAYEQGKFCDIFHLRASGWRSCESCRKQIHCGCIVSASAFTLLDAGGIECLACTRKKFGLGPNFPPSPSFLFQSPVAEKIKDSSIYRCSSTGSNQISCPSPSLLSPSVLQFDLHNHRESYKFSQPTSRDSGTVYPTEKNMGMNDLMENLMSENSKNQTSYMLDNQKAGPNCKVPHFNVYHPLISLKEGLCGTNFAFPVPITTPIEKNGHLRLDGNNLRHTPNSSPRSCLHNDLNGVADSLFNSKSENLRRHFDAPGKYQVVPRYWPKVSDEIQVLRNQSKESKSIATTLFEKMLSASDTGRTGRLMLPKKCAEAFFPQISHPEGVPLKVEDRMGKEWIFQFRFWPNHKSRMYFVEGVTPCLQSMQLQAGDRVIFSRLDPEKKLIIGYRKASVAQSSDQETGSTVNNRDTCTNEGDAEPTEQHSQSIVKKSAYKAKPTPGVDISSRKMKSSLMITKSKRQKVEKGDHNEVKLTWEEAQGFILPPPSFSPSIVVIEQYEFEEYEDVPIIGKPTGFRPSGSAEQELIVEEHDEVTMKEVEGPSMSLQETTKHPRHRIGCTCIVCIQSPSGLGPKHDRCCLCTVCDMVKRRKGSLLLRRKKKQLEKEINAHKELESLNSGDKLHQSARNGMNHDHQFSHLKGQIDLNFQPGKDEESLPGSNTTTNNNSLRHDGTSKPNSEPSSSSSVHSQIVTEVADTTTTTSSCRF
ncbi:unnamed protein product [Cochlearia groenlandica]